MAVNIPSQIVVQTAAQWAADATVYSAKRILVTSDEFYGSTDQRKFKIADGVQTWANLDYMPIGATVNPTTNILPVKNASGGFDDSNLRQDGSGLVECITKLTALDGLTTFTNGNGFFVFDSTGAKEFIKILNTGAVNMGWNGTQAKFTITDPTDTRALIQTSAGFIFGEESSNLFGLFTGSIWAWDTNKTTGQTTFFVAPKLDSLTASTVLELDASKNVISVAKETAYNKPFGTGTTNVPAIGATLGNTQTVKTDATGKLVTAAFGEITMNLSQSFFNPANNTKYYFGQPAGAPPTTAGLKVFRVPIACKLTRLVVKLEIVGSLGSTQNGTIGVRIGGVETNITTTFQAGVASRNDLFTGLNFNIGTSDDVEFFYLTPTFTSLPTNINVSFIAYFEPQ